MLFFKIICYNYNGDDNMKSDIDIYYDTKLLKINDIAKKLNIDENYLECYGKYKAKIDLSISNFLKNKKEGKLILITSTNPTPFGEGKTTMSIGIDDALCKLNKKSLVVLREPSLGPVFGIKGGATGGGYSQVVPMEDINLHFTGDMHAITSANNLLCAAIDNHIFQGNLLNIKKVTFSRCMDMNDRALREIKVGLGEKNGIERNDSFVITVASEIMAILCLSSDIIDLKKRLGNINFGYYINDNPLYVKDLHVEESMTILLKDAIKPNLVQTLENNPALIHGGPFANIAHGCNSIIATKLGLKLADYVVTEAGFGADLGAEKFLDIKCRKANIKPDVIVINTTIRSIKYNGNCPKEELTLENINYLKNGLDNLFVHIENMKKYLNNVIVCLNKFYTDTEEEIEYVRNFVKSLNCEFEVSESFSTGGNGALNLAKKIISLADTSTNLNLLYKDDISIIDKIKKITKEIYRADDIIINDDILDKINKIESLGYKNLEVCIAKTQYSLSDNPKLLGHPKNFKMIVRDVKLCSGAGFIVVYMGNIMTMPGLSKEPSYLKMHIN